MPNNRSTTTENIFSYINEIYRPQKNAIDENAFGEIVANYSDFITEFKLDTILPCLGESLLLLAGDLSGIQDTVYTISSKGALKSLRARSFMLELLCEHCCYELLTGLMDDGGYKELRSHVVFSGGGRFCLLLPDTSSVKDGITNFKEEINNWAFDEFSGRLYVAIAYVTASSKELNMPVDFERKWRSLSDELDYDKRRKFSWKLDTIFSREGLKEPTLRTNEQECQICHRDDIEVTDGNLLQPFFSLTSFEQICTLSDLIATAENAPVVHELCYRLFSLGDALSDEHDEIYRFDTQPATEGFLKFPALKQDFVYYALEDDDSKATFIWKINSCQDPEMPIFCFANYVRMVGDLPDKAQEIEKKLYSETHKFELKDPKNLSASFSGLANAACGANLIACLRMDIDNLGKIFSRQGWEKPEDFTLNSLATLSRLLNLFFKVYLNTICQGEIEKPTDITQKNYHHKTKDSERRGAPGRNVSVIYSGGDDLFIVGAWDEIAELSFDIQCCFAQYSGLGISGGVTLHKPKFPLYQMARLSGKAEFFAKNDVSHQREKPKNRIALFYDLNKKVRREAIIKSLSSLANPADAKDRYRLAVTWGEVEKFAIPFTRQMRSFGEIKDGKLRLQKLPAAIVEKLFMVAEEWQRRGQIYLPTMARIIEQTKSNLPPEEFIKFLTYLYSCKTNNIKKIHIPLTWISYLRR